MALQAQQIVALATQQAGAPGFSVMAGELLNLVLDELCQTYDLDITKGTAAITLGNGSGPYTLPADYLRSDFGDVYFTINGTPYPLTPIDPQEYDMLVQPPSTSSSYPSMYSTSQPTVGAAPVLYVWPPASSAFPLTVRYRRQMPSITSPETSSEVPWFPNSNYLVTRLAGELMKVTDDTRAAEFLGDGEGGAQGILRRYLRLKDDSTNRADFVKLDRRIFGRAWTKVPNTKFSGW